MQESFRFTDDEIRQRFVDHCDVAEQYCESFGKDFSVNVVPQKRKLYLAIISAYKDVERYKNFHLNHPTTDKADAIKRAAYLVKWICRFKPIYVAFDEEAEIGNFDLDGSILVNELFALHVAFMHLSDFAGRDFILTDNRQWELVYDLLYRHVTEDALMFIFQTLLYHAKNQKIIDIY